MRAELISKLRPLSNRWKVTCLSLVYAYSHRKTSDNRHILIKSVHTHTARIRLTIYTGLNYSFPLVFFSDVGSSTPRAYCREPLFCRIDSRENTTILNIKSSVRHNLSYILSSYAHTSPFYTLITNLIYYPSALEPR